MRLLHARCNILTFVVLIFLRARVHTCTDAVWSDADVRRACTQEAAAGWLLWQRRTVWRHQPGTCCTIIYIFIHHNGRQKKTQNMHKYKNKRKETKWTNLTKLYTTIIVNIIIIIIIIYSLNQHQSCTAMQYSGAGQQGPNVCYTTVSSGISEC